MHSKRLVAGMAECWTRSFSSLVINSSNLFTLQTAFIVPLNYSPTVLIELLFVTHVHSCLLYALFRVLHTHTLILRVFDLILRVLDWIVTIYSGVYFILWLQCVRVCMYGFCNVWLFWQICGWFGNVCNWNYCVLYCFVYVYLLLLLLFVLLVLVLGILPPSENAIVVIIRGLEL